MSIRVQHAQHAPRRSQAGLQIQADLRLIPQISGSYFKCRGGCSQIFPACCSRGSRRVSWRGVAVVVVAVRGCGEEVSRTVDTVLFALFEKAISKNKGARSVLFIAIWGLCCLCWYTKGKHFCNLLQLGNVVIPVDSEMSFINDLGQSQPPNQAMAEKVMSKNNDQHCIRQG